MIEAFGPAVAGATDKVIGDLVQPVAQGLAEGIQPLESQLSRLGHPGLQSLFPLGRCSDTPVLEESPQLLALLCQLLQLRESLLQFFQFGLLLFGQVLPVFHPQPARTLQLFRLLLAQLTLDLTARLGQLLLEVLHHPRFGNGRTSNCASPWYLGACGPLTNKRSL